MTIKVLIDSGVLLDFFFKRQPFANDAANLLFLCEEKKIQGFVTPLSYSNMYYILRKTATHQKVIKHFTNLFRITQVLAMDEKVVEAAIQSKFKDFEDALQNFSIQKCNGINLILTRNVNVKDYKFSTLGVMTPETFLKSNLISN